MATSSARRGLVRSIPELRPLSPMLLVAGVILVLAILVLPQSDAKKPEERTQDVAMVAPFTSSDWETPTASIEPATTGMTSELTAFKTPIPTATPRRIRRLPTATPSPTPTPRFLPEQYVANGGFENGSEGWYVEPGAEITGTLVRRGAGAMRIDASGGFASSRFPVVPGTAYRLSAWGIMSAVGDTGIIGVEYFDGYGRSVGRYDHPLVFTEPEFVGRAFTFTPVSGASAAQVYIWKPNGTAIFVVDDISIRAFIHHPGIEER